MGATKVRPAITDAQRKIALSVMAEGGSLAQAATASGMSTKSIERLRKSTGLATRVLKPYTDEELAVMESMLKDGASYEEVARTTGRNISGIKQRFPGMGWTKEQTREWSSWAMSKMHARKKLHMTSIGGTPA